MVTKIHARGSRSPLNIRLLCASQTLYGKKVLDNVATHGRKVAEFLDGHLPFQVSFGQVVTSPETAEQAIRIVNNDPYCVALAVWPHTFSPSMMWVKALKGLQRPLLHLSTQWQKEIPKGLNMAHMNENQTAHGNREFSHALVDLGIRHANIVGYWENNSFVDDLETHGRVAAGIRALETARIACIGGRKMRNVAVTDVAITDLQVKLGPTVHDYEIDDLLTVMEEKVSTQDVNQLVRFWDKKYAVASELGPKGARRESLLYAARVTLGIKALLEKGGYNGFTTNFETLGGLKQLQGLAAQILMAEGFGFGAEGDVQAASLLRAFQAMDPGLAGGSTFSEPYTWDLTAEGGEIVLNSHMLEISPRIADPREKPRLEIHPLSIGGREDPPRLVFNVAGGLAGIVTSLFNLRERGFQLTTNTVRTLPPEDFPNLPTARILYSPYPAFVTAEKCWLATGASHHPIFSTAVTAEYVDILARMLGIPHHLIDEKTNARDFLRQLN